MAKRQRKVPMLDYAREDTVAALAACRKYLDGALEFLNDKASLPNSSEIAGVRFHGQSLQAKPIDAALSISAPTIVAEIEDATAERGKRDRYFDPWYFAVLRLLELPGGRFLFGPSKRGQYYYVIYVGPASKTERHQLTRFIANTPIWADTKHGQHDDYSYRDYRRVTLKWQSKLKVRALGLNTRSVSLDRSDAIKFAISLFKRQIGRKRTLPGLGISSRDYERLLGMAVAIADAVHEKLLSQRATVQKPAE